MIINTHPDGDDVATVPDRQPNFTTQERSTMLLHEILARARMQEDQRRASQERLARRLRAVRRWRRVARYAERQAQRAAGLL